jgi:hypothetical protein
LKELARTMTKKKLMKLMNLLITVDHSFYTTLPFTPVSLAVADVIGHGLSIDSRGVCIYETINLTRI